MGSTCCWDPFHATTTVLPFCSSCLRSDREGRAGQLFSTTPLRTTAGRDTVAQAEQKGSSRAKESVLVLHPPEVGPWVLGLDCVCDRVFFQNLSAQSFQTFSSCHQRRFHVRSGRCPVADAFLRVLFLAEVTDSVTVTVSPC